MCASQKTFAFREEAEDLAAADLAGTRSEGAWWSHHVKRGVALVAREDRRGEEKDRSGSAVASGILKVRSEAERRPEEILTLMPVPEPCSRGREPRTVAPSGSAPRQPAPSRRRGCADC
jgi:hypothetical protein